MLIPNIKRELEKKKSREYYQNNKEKYVENQKKYNRTKIDIHENRLYKQNYYKQQKKKTKVSNQIKGIAQSIPNIDNTGLVVLIRNMKSRKYQKQKRDVEILKRNVLFEFKLTHGDNEPNLYMRSFTKQKPKTFFKILKIQKTISFY